MRDLTDILTREPKQSTRSCIPSFTNNFDAGFNKRWTQYPKPQVTTLSMWEAKTPWRKGDLQGLSILDAGCGIGRFMRIALEYGAAWVVGVDAAPDALLAAEKLLSGDKVSLMQADLLDIPIKPQTFDRAYSIGVLHHTSDPRAAFMQVADKVKIGGELAVWLYSQPLDARWHTAEKMLHEITRSCAPDVLHHICEKYAATVRDDYAGAWEPLTQILRVSTSANDEECISDTFDWHAPQYRSWHTVPEVMKWFNAAGYEVTNIMPDFPVSVCGRRLG